MEKLTRTLDNYLNPLTVAEWLEKAMAAPILSAEAENLLQSLIAVDSTYREAFGLHPTGCTLAYPTSLKVEVTLELLEELHAIVSEHANIFPPSGIVKYHWMQIGEHPSPLTITLYTPKAI